jgi:hypothetical protein
MHGTCVTVMKIINRTFGKGLHPTVYHRSYKYFPSRSVLAPLLGYGEHKLSRSPGFFYADLSVLLDHEFLLQNCGRVVDKLTLCMNFLVCLMLQKAFHKIQD